MTQVLSGTPDALVGEAADRTAVVAAEAAAAAVAAAAPVTGIAAAAVNAASAALATASAEAAQTAAEASAGATHAAVLAAARAGRPGAKAPARANSAVAAAEAFGVAGTVAQQPNAAQTSPAAAVVTRPEFAVFLADPMLPHFDPGVQPGAAVSLASPAEQGLWRDISLAQRIRTQLHQSEAGFEAVFAGAPAPLLVAALVAGRPGEFVRVNFAMSQLTGYSAAELLGLHFADLAHPSQRHLEANLSRLRQPLDHTPAERVRRWVHADGHDLWVRIRTASPRGSAVRGQQVVCHVEAVQR